MELIPNLELPEAEQNVIGPIRVGPDYCEFVRGLLSIDMSRRLNISDLGSSLKSRDPEDGSKIIRRLNNGIAELP